MKNRFPLLVLPTYLALTADFSIVNIVVGILMAVAIGLLLPSSTKAMQWKRVPNAVLSGVVYSLALLKDTIWSGFAVSKVVLTPSIDLKTGVIKVNCHVTNEVQLALLAHSITLTPGEMVIGLDPVAGVLSMHCLDVEESERTIRETVKKRSALLERILL